MTESKAAEMVSDMIRDCFELGEKTGFDTFEGTMLIEGECVRFRDVKLAEMPGTSGFAFEQSGFRYTVNVLAERVGRGSA